MVDLHRSLAVTGALLIAGATAVQAQVAVNTGTSGVAGDATPLQATAARWTGPAAAIDGRLDEGAWARAGIVTDFIQMRPSPGSPASARTEARVLYDDDALYIGMFMADAPDSIAAQLVRRDASGTFTDWAHVMIDSYHDRRTAFRFSVTPRGAKKDVLHYNDTQEDLNWDAVWDVATAVNADGWTAEFRIPLSQLRFSRGDGEGLVWGINFGREIARRGEWAWWSPVLPRVGGLVSQAGELIDLEAVRPPRRIEVIPYTVARVTAAPDQPGNPFYARRDGDAAVGGDLRLGIGSNLTLSATVNPDFGQVEADPSVVNLTAFETFFPEKRPFFTEGANIFSFRIGTDDHSGENLFYSRRLGRAPQRFVAAPGGWTDVPETTTILGAAKLTGRTAGGWTIGALGAFTAREEARIARTGVETLTTTVEPRSQYGAFSLTRDFRRGRSSIGFLGTAVHRELDDPGLAFLRSSAWVGGVNTRHRFANDTWETSGYLAGSHIRGGEEAILRVQLAPGHYYQRPDAGHIEVDPTRTSLSGAIGQFILDKVGGGNVRGAIGTHFRTPGFEVNDVGFQQEADQAVVFANLRLHQFQPRGIFRSFHVGLNPSAAWNWDGDRVWTQLGSFGNYELRNFWGGGWWAARQFSALSPGTLRGGPAVQRPASWRFSTWLNSDRRKSVTGALSASGGAQDGTGAWDLSLRPSVSFRPSTQLNVTLEPGLGRARNTWQYLGQPVAGATPVYLMGELDQTTVSLTTRINYTISPTLSFELYAQPFLSGGDFTAFRTLGAARSGDFDERFPRIAAGALTYDAATRRYRADTNGDGSFETVFANPDFNFRQMRGNAVVRWEYLPGSTLFLVWGQSRTAYLQGEPGDAFALGRDARRLFNSDDGFPTPVTNVFLIKVSHWINP